MKKNLFFFLILFLFFGCKSIRQPTLICVEKTISVKNRQLIDSILQWGLDREALYTLMGNIKPMSSLQYYQLPLTKRSSIKSYGKNTLIDFEKLSQIQQAVNQINIPDLKFVVIPYNRIQDNCRLVQLSVLRVSVMDSLLKAKNDFFGRYGLVPGADPAVVVSTIENALPAERNRGYGYLFGYPDYAVDFFVEASQKLEKTKELAARNFFQIPVYKRKDGYFVYAYPKNYTPTFQNDSLRYYRSIKVLTNYTQIRKKYMNPDSTIQAYKLLVNKKTISKNKNNL